MGSSTGTNIISNTDWLVNLLRMAFLETYQSGFPPTTRDVLAAKGATPSSVMEQLDQEIKRFPLLEASLHPKIRNFLENYRLEKIQQSQATPAIAKVKQTMKQKPTRQEPQADVSIQVDREPFFQIGRALQRGLGKGKLGCVTLSAKDGVLTIESDWGGSRIPCTKGPAISATVSATAFCALITTRFREKQPSGAMTIVFRPKLKEVGIDLIGVKAQFDPC